MMIRFRVLAATLYSFLAITFSIAGVPEKAQTLRVALVGDSTVCDYPVENPERGWGQVLPVYFDAGVTVLNFAKSGRSTKTFRTEGLWKKVLEAKPNFVLIQLGHNDSHTHEKPEATHAATDYQDNLRRFIKEARAIGAKPVLITPMVRRMFGENGQLINELQPYADAMKKVGAEENVPMIDLHETSKKLVQSLGERGSATMANKAGDMTHFGQKGAEEMAKLVLKELPLVVPELSKHLRAP